MTLPDVPTRAARFAAIVFVGALAVGCASDSSRPGAGMTTSVPPAPTGTDSSAAGSPTTDGAERPDPTTTSDSMPDSMPDSTATSVAAVVTSAVTAVVTTLGDLLTDAEVAEIEAVLDDLDAVLAEIDADLADVPDP